MDDQSLRNVLAILRGVQNMKASNSASQFIDYLAGKEVNPRTKARIAAYILDQVQQASVVIENSQLVDEAKAGVRSALKGIETAFLITNLNGQLNPLVPNSAGYIANFVILLSAAGLPTEAAELPDAIDLSAEIRDFSTKFDDDALDPVVRDIARKHLEALATLLRHVPIFGLEAALSAYFELMMKLRRVDSQATPEAKKALDPLISKVKSWGDKITAIDKTINSGANLLGRVKGASKLLEYIPM